MADLPGFGSMDVGDRGGRHDFGYGDKGAVGPSPGLTPSQTIGPFFAYGLTPGPYAYALPELHRTDLAGPETEGTPITIEGQIFDGTGTPVHDAMIEIVQADAAGRYVTEPRNDGFTGFGRAGTGAEGPRGDTRFVFRTIRPGPTMQGAAPFVTLILFLRGVLNHCVTRMYFPSGDLASDPVMSQVPPDRRSTLVGTEIAPNRYRFDIRLQGPEETVFFDV